MGLDMNLYRAPRYGTLAQIFSLYEKLSENEYAYRDIMEEVKGCLLYTSDAADE